MKIFSFFSGVGMLDLGFQEAGYDVVFVNEHKPEFITSYQYARRNQNYRLPQYGYHICDVKCFLDGPNEQLLYNLIKQERQKKEFIGFIGGPPCPDFSVGGKNLGREGDNGKLARNYIDIICHFKPDIFLFENVKGLIKTQKHRDYFEELKHMLQQSGFILSQKLLNSLDFGVPQDRERVLLIGIKEESALAKRVICMNKTFAFPWNNGLPYDSKKIKQLNWPSPEKYREYSKRKFKYQIPIDLTVEYWFIKNNVYRHQNTKDVFKVRSGKSKIDSIMEGDTSRKSFKRLHRWKFSPTAAYGNNEVHLHPYRTRRLSVAEAMAIQSLPRWFELPKNVCLSAKFKMIGNGVPYVMSLEIARRIKTYFNL
ncbi:MAG: DNA cytosine methyltransferase [bacterium]|nr:DNA cytosine methyltransferase [bacterium]MCM1376171.1 DNA cytosine methyltransferase [Muribaculum sp.]